MRLVKLVPALLAASAVLSPASATPLPVGLYSVSAHTVTNTIHASVDQGTLTGFVTFSASSVLTAANLVFQDTTTGLSYTVTQFGGTEYTPAAHTLSAVITSAATLPRAEYDFSVMVPSSSDVYRLGCGVDCDTDFYIYDNSGNITLVEELQGNIAPAPEPSSLLLVGTGLIAGVGVLRRKLTL